MSLSRTPAILLLAAAAAACGGDSTAGPSAALPPRGYFMGFGDISPRPDAALAIQTIDLWAQRADAGLLIQVPPWTALLAGEDPETLVRSDSLGIASYYRGKGLRIVATIDPANGFDRSGDSAELVAAGHSLTEPGVRELYARYVAAFASIVRPDELGVASETNLTRATAPPAFYAALVDAAGQAASAARSAFPRSRLFSTVQVDVAWGRLVPAEGYVGVARDRADFPFIEVLGLSSYPYLAGFSEPEELPLDYYARLVQDAPLPLIVVESGWTSASLGVLASSPDKQRRYIERQAQLLDAAQAVGLFQIAFTDLDVSSYGLPSDSILSLFAFLGLVDVNLAAKPALASWDAIYRRPRR